MRKTETTLTDVHGEAIRYECTPFGFDAAFDLGLKLAAVVGGPLGEAFKGLLLGSTLDDAGLDDAVIGGAVASIGDLPNRLIAAGGSELLADILANVHRFGSDDGGTVRQRMCDSDDRDAAYAGGNLREAMDAARWVIEVNYGPFLTGLWDELRPLLSGLAADLTTPAETPSSEVKPAAIKPVEVLRSSSSTPT